MPRARKSYMSPAEFRVLRESAGLSIDAWATLLDCGPQSVRNIESGSSEVGRQMAVLAMLMAHPDGRNWLLEAYRHKEKLLREEDKNKT